jgi:NADH-quinone oxidoreductase subunit L
MYKSCLFLTGGSVEKQAGTTDLAKLGGLGRKMPITFACFVIAAASISGVPPFNGFFSKELIYDGALESGWIFYAAAVLGSFFTAASFLKLGHAAFLGKGEGGGEGVKEASWPMLLPMIIIAGLCILFGVNNAWPLNHLIQPILGSRLEGHSFAGWPHSAFLVIMTLIVLLVAWLNHLYGIAKTGKGIGAVDHIHYAPVLSGLYDKAEKRYFDPYDLGMKFTELSAKILLWFDRAIDWIYEVFTVRLVQSLTGALRWLHSGNFSTYIIWALFGVVMVVYLGLR